jgi:hypothetical protein
MPLNFSFSKEFLKPECQGDNLSKGVPRSNILQGFDKLLKFIQRYFTCGGGFNMVYQYHIRILLHFTGKEAMNLPFYLFISIGNMVDTVQSKSEKVYTSFFHSGLIKILVMEELRKTNTNWETFLTSSQFQLNVDPTPQSKIQSPTPVKRIVCSEVIKKKMSAMNDIDDRATNETEVGGPSQPSDEESLPMENPTPMEVPSRKSTGLRGRKIVFSSRIVADNVKTRRPFTREATNKNVPVKDDAIETSA